MANRANSASFHFCGCPSRQRGQALIYGLFVLIGGLAALFFLFNTGQLTSEKVKLVNTADAAVYSGGVMNARALNFAAYTNRAMVANTVAIAQLVSLSSWIKYANTLANCANSTTYGSTCGAYADLNTPYKYPALYPSYLADQNAGPELKAQWVDTKALEKLETGSDDIIHAVLMTAQKAAYTGLLYARQEVMQDVANANYHNDGSVTVDSFPLSGNEFNSFVSRYSGTGRKRFAEVATTSANLDPFVPKRSWTLPALYANCISASPRVDWLDRRGGTNLIGYDEWRAVDTLAEKVWVPKDKTDVLCQGLSEEPAAFGLQDAAQNPTMFDADPRHYDASELVNPATTSEAQISASMSSASWAYQGLPSFYDLSTAALNRSDPRMVMAIRVTRELGQTRTSEGRSSVAPTPHLNNYKANFAGGAEMVAVSASEVFFQRPDGATFNIYGQSIGKPNEIGSLFNPYWQVHLVQSDQYVGMAQAMQGAALP